MPTSAADYYRAKRDAASLTPQRSPRRVHDLIRASIRAGEFAPGDKLDELSLIIKVRTSRNAVREALQLLAQEGLLTRSPREGTTVAAATLVEMPLDNLISDALAEHIDIVRLSDERVPSTPSVRARLQTDAAEIGAIEHLFTLRGMPIGVLTNYYTDDVAQPVGWNGCPDIRSAIYQIYGVEVGWIDTTIEAQLCEPRTTRLLGLTERVPVLVREQLVHDTDGRPLCLMYSHFLTDRIALTVRSTPNAIPHRATQQPRIA
jgi:GntR family transcriptional regulator